MVAKRAALADYQGMHSPRAPSRLLNQWDSFVELETVRVFAVVAQLASFRRAATSLRMPPSTVSRRLATLETALKTRLLHRTTRHVSLTDAGEAFLAQVAPALAMIGDAGRTLLDAHAAPRGLLRVTAPLSMAEPVGEGLVQLMAKYPNVSLELNVTNRHVDLVAEGYDIAVRYGPLPDSSLIARPLGRGQSGYYASPAYVERRGKPRAPRDLLRHDCVVFSGARVERWQFSRGKRVEEIAVNKRIIANTFALVRLAVVAGQGIGLLPTTVAEPDVASGKLVPVLPTRWPPPRPFHLVYPSSRHLAPQVRAAVDVLVAKLALPR